MSTRTDPTIDRSRGFSAWWIFLIIVIAAIVVGWGWGGWGGWWGYGHRPVAQANHAAPANGGGSTASANGAKTR